MSPWEDYWTALVQLADDVLALSFAPLADQAGHAGEPDPMAPPAGANGQWRADVAHRMAKKGRFGAVSAHERSRREQPDWQIDT